MPETRDKKLIRLCYAQATLSLEIFSAPVLVFFYTEYAGFNFRQYSTIISLILILNWAFEIPAGAFADRHGRKLALVGGNCIYIAAMIFLLRYGRTMPAWAIALLFSLGSSLSSGTFQAIMYDTFGAKNHALFHAVNARATSISLISSGVGAAVGGWLATTSLAIPMLIDIFFLFVVTLLFFLFLDEVGIASSKATRLSIGGMIRTGIHASVSSKALLLAIFTTALIFACLRATFNVYQPLLRQGGLAFASIGTVFAGFSILSAFSAYVFSHLPKSVLISQFPVVGLASLFGLSAVAVILSNAGDSIILIIVAIGLHQISRGVYPSYSTYTVNRLAPENTASRTTILSIASLFRAAVCAGFIYAVGYFAEAIDFAASFAISSLAAAALLALSIVFRTAKNECSHT